MAFNKEDAMIAMKIAEEKLCNRDYARAKEVALMAKKLFPQLDNIDQLLAVCEVHCSAQLMDNDMYDWYKIIQVDSVSDEILIRKQYRKLALLLHPDKNKYPGAEAAFKLVGEANNTLSDRYKRTIYDVKRRHLVTAASWQQSTQMSAAHNFSSSIFNSKKQQKQQPQPQPQPHQGFTFLTACPSCRARHQYYLNILYKMVRCINCSRTFTADAPPHLNPGNMSGARNQPQHFPVAGTTRDRTGAVRKHDRNPNPKPTTSNSSGSNTVTGQRRGKRVSADTREPNADPFPNQNPNPGSQPKCSTGAVRKHDRNPNSKLATSNASGANNITGQRRGKMNTADTSKPSANPSLDQNPSPTSQPKCSTVPVMKHDSNPNSKRTTSNSGGLNTVTGQRRGKRLGADTREPSSDPSPDQNPNPSSEPMCSSDVSPNRGGRDQTNGRIHVVVTSMPLRRSLSNNPAAENNGSEADILSPAKKAKFEVKRLQYGDGGMDVRNTGTNASTAFKGEAIEQDRDKGKEQVKLSGSAGDKDLDPQAANVGIYPDSVPEIRTGVAALFKESQARFEGNGREESTECRGLNPSNGDTSRVNNKSDHTWTQRCESPQPSADASWYAYPDAEFHNFDMCRTCDKFQQNQIWALYSDLDTNPKYYGWVRKVESKPFKVHISWLVACPKSEVEKGWLDRSLPISCGKFKVQTQNVIYDDPTYFSHTVTYYERGKYCEILPEIGEIWAVYKNWSPGWSEHDLVTCEYDIVLIKKRGEESTVVLPMRQVPKYKSVFVPEKVDKRGSDAREIPPTKYVLFSHRIPAVRLYGEHKGLWELDPASVPFTFFNRAK